MFTPNSIYHILSKLFDPIDLTYHLIFVKIYLTGGLCFYGFHGQNEPKIGQNLFHTIRNNSINKKTALEKKNLRRSKIGGAVRGRFDRGQRFNGFFFLKPSLNKTRNPDPERNGFEIGGMLDPDFETKSRRTHGDISIQHSKDTFPNVFCSVLHKGFDNENFPPLFMYENCQV